MPRLRQTLLVAPVAWAVMAAPAAGAFNDVLQVICDADNIITTGCDATPDGLTYVYTIAVSPDDKHVYICSALDDSGQAETLSAFSRAGDGTLTLVDQEIQGTGSLTTLDSCRGLAVSPDGKHVYTAALVSNAVALFLQERDRHRKTARAGRLD